MTALAALGPTLFMREGSKGYDHVAELRANMAASDPEEAAREFDCVVGAMREHVLHQAHDVDRAVSRSIRRTAQHVCAGADFADGGAIDWSALALTERQGGLLVVVALEWVKPEASPMPPSQVAGKFCRIALDAGAQHLACDNHNEETVQRAARDAGVAVRIISNKPVEMAEYVHDLLREGKLVIPAEENLIRQMKAIRIRYTSSGKAIERPRTKALGHCDLVSALEAAAQEDFMQHGPLPAMSPPDSGGGTQLSTNVVPIRRRIGKAGWTL